MRLKKDPFYNFDAPRIFVLHHHLLPVTQLKPLDDNNQFGLILQSESVQSILFEEDFHLVLHGHHHHPFLRIISNPTLKNKTEKNLVISGSGSFGAYLDHPMKNHFQLIDATSSSIRIQWYESKSETPDSFEGTRVFNYPPQKNITRYSSKPFLIAISGSISVGKTTLAKHLKCALETEIKNEEIILIDEVARKLIGKGVTSDEKTEFNDYARYFNEHFCKMNSVKQGVYIFDRTMLDTLAYAEANKNVPEVWLSMLNEIAQLYSTLFDVYLYVPIEEFVPFENDGVRTTNIQYRDIIDEHMRKILLKYRDGYQSIHGTIKQRVDLAQKIILKDYADKKF
jgi:nicotinamide riboside kinase